MGAKRCSRCGINWPVGTQNCTCGEPTSYMTNAEPMDVDEATWLQRQSEFEAWLLTPEGRAADATARRENDRREREFQRIAESLEADVAV